MDNPIPVKVTIAHGNIAFARYPVLIGHYAGEVPSDGERYLDGLLQNQLQRSMRLGLYPGEVGTARVFLAKSDSLLKHAGALVVGLGKVGELSPGKLIETVTHGLLEYATKLLENSDAADSQTQSAPLTMLLTGTGPKGLPIESAIAATLEGVFQANAALTNKGFPIAIDVLEFMELWEDRAIMAAHAIRHALIKPELCAAFDPGNGFVIQTLGGHIRAALAQDRSDWQRLQIKGTADGSLQFTLITERARSEVEIVQNQKQLVDNYVDESTHYIGSQEKMSQTLFELLIPNTLKDQLHNRENLLLMLNEASAKYPWELLVDPANPNKRPLSIDVKMIRKLDTAVYEKQVNTSLHTNALVVGNPQSSLPDLPAAKAEAEAIQNQLLHNSYEVTGLIDSTSYKIIDALLTGDYRILHLAGHGFYNVHPSHLWPPTDADQPVSESDDALVSGMVIGDRIFLTPADVEKMQTIPELVFINCCNLGKTEEPSAVKERQLHHLAANLAEEFMRIGVKALVAAGWSVEDNSSNLFATTFYKEMLHGASFGKAVLTGRQAVYEKYQSFNTWGAYQCYGDPAYRLSDTANPADSSEVRERIYHSVSELRDYINNLVHDIRTLPAKDVAAGKAELEGVVTNIPEVWLADAALCALLGQAYGELGNFEQSVKFCTLAVGAETATFSFDLLETMADVKSQQAVNLWETGNSQAGSPAAELIAESIVHLQTALAFGRTARRLSLLGTVYMRQAIITAGQDRIVALGRMKDYCHQAYAFSIEKALAGDTVLRPALNSLTAAIVLSWYEPANEAEKMEIRQGLQDMVDYLGQNQPTDTDYYTTYSSIKAVDINFLTYLHQGDQYNDLDKLTTAFQTAHNKTLSPISYQAVLERLAFVRAMAEQKRPDLFPFLYQLHTNLLEFAKMK